MRELGNRGASRRDGEEKGGQVGREEVGRRGRGKGEWGRRICSGKRALGKKTRDGQGKNWSVDGGRWRGKGEGWVGGHRENGKEKMEMMEREGETCRSGAREEARKEVRGMLEGARRRKRE